MVYVTQWRMNQAARWLSSTDWSVEQVAEGVGYISVAAFSRAFSRTMSISSARYRKAHSSPLGQASEATIA